MTDLERVAAAHWRGTEEEWLGDWLLRAAGGFTGRANSALPLGDPGLPLDDALAVVTRWYRDRGLPPMIAVPTPIEAKLRATSSMSTWRAGCGDRRALPSSWSPACPSASRRTCLPAAVRSGSAPSPTTHGPLGTTTGARTTCRLCPAGAHLRREQSFVSIRDGGHVLAIARLSIAGGWAGLTAVEVHPGHRREGLGAAITAAACLWRSGAGSRVFLQVEEGNAPAQALYERLGFRYAHRYHYRVAPE